MCTEHPHPQLVGRCDDTPDLFPDSRHSMRHCSILPARRIGAAEDTPLNGCIIPNGINHDIHLSRLDNDTTVQWYDDYECGCCSWDESDRCFVHAEVTDAFEYQWLLAGRMTNEVMPPRLVKTWTLREHRIMWGSDNAGECWDCGECISPVDECLIRWTCCLYSDGSRHIHAEYRHDICPCDDGDWEEDSGDTDIDLPMAA